MNMVYNFAAGPAVLPREVLLRAQREFLNFRGTGMSITETSHRSKEFLSVIEGAEKLLRSLMGIPDSYCVLFLQGGATTQFSMVPMNLMRSKKADYVVTGLFAGKAAKEAEKFGDVAIAASSADRNFSYIPRLEPGMFRSSADYVHITSNNTVYGTRFTSFPDTEAPLVADMSSNICSEAIDVRRFGLIYAGAQKNLGPSGLCVVIVRRGLLGFAPPSTPAMMDYKVHAENGSMFNTPATFAVYMAGLVFEWMAERGGIAVIEKANREKAALLYDALSGSAFYTTTAEPEFRSLMNVTFTLPTQELTDEFVAAAASEGLVNLRGHRAVGGIRASLYNAMPIEGAAALASFIKRFEAKKCSTCSA
ncbi:MAG: 3-phosphoserine/phosphohydroxythreonine transaminase [Synergistaceae bacterium]|jgi:phosphoserine aminotransferase|nr:3-phosphoserine/phosphohydroxythreonine transaminase [Synergistaceae bacterium]